MLALLLILIGAASAAPAPCPLKTYEPDANGWHEARIPATHPACVGALRGMPDFERLRAAAGLDPGAVSFALLIADADNAHYGQGQVLVDTGYFDRHRSRATWLALIAHELAHAVQDRRPEGRLNERFGDTQIFSRRYEAQADGIAQQLLVAAGFPAGTLLVGDSRYFGCRLPLNGPLEFHPRTRQRLVNHTVGQRLFARRAALGDARAAFDGARRAAAPVLVPAQLPARPFRPIAQLRDYDSQGRLLPGRLVANKLRVRPPAPAAPPPVRAAQHLARSAVNRVLADPFEAAVNGLVRRRRLSEAVLRVCGTPKADELARDLSVWGWTRRIAADAARRTARRLLG